MDRAASIETGRQFTRYAMVGLASNALIYIAYIALTQIGLDPRLAMSLLYVLGILQTFVFNRAWSFRFTGSMAPALSRYIAIYALGYAINLSALWLLVNQAGLPHQWVMAGLILFMAVFFFVGQKVWVFRQVPSPAMGVEHEKKAGPSPAESPGHIRRLFGVYSFFENLVRMVLELLPHALRYWAFKALLHRLGPESFIDYQTYFRYPWQTSIGQGVWINRGCEFYGSIRAGGTRITIGDHSALGPHVRVLSATHNHRLLTLPDQAAGVTIGCHVWVGAGALILPGVSIGDGAVVAAGSVVTRDVAPYCIVAGNPARFIKHRELDDASALQ